MSLALLRLFRLRLALLAALGTLAGYVLFRPAPGAGPLLAGAASLALAAGCSALNQVQERAEDARMARTRTRPLPAGLVSAPLALGLALGLAALGLGLAAACAPAAAGVGLGVVALYNGLYTPLKKRTALALLAGGLAGSAPPLLGWAAAGGPLPALPPLAVAGVLYVWQVPHFWLLAWRQREDYAAAGFKAPGPFPYRGKLPLAVWLAAYCAALLFVPAFNLVDSAPAKWLCVGLAATLAAGSGAILGRHRLGLALINASMLLFLCGMAADAYFHAL